MSVDLEAIKAKIDSRGPNTTLGDFFQDLLGLVAEVESLLRVRSTLLEHVRACGPYSIGRQAEVLIHADPCDCDEDNEQAGEACMGQSDWTYAVFAKSGE